MYMPSEFQLRFSNQNENRSFEILCANPSPFLDYPRRVIKIPIHIRQSPSPSSWIVPTLDCLKAPSPSTLHSVQPPLAAAPRHPLHPTNASPNHCPCLFLSFPKITNGFVLVFTFIPSSALMVLFIRYVPAYTLFCLNAYLSVARSSIKSVLDQAITKGQLTIHDSEGTHCYGRHHGDSHDVHLTVADNNFWTRILVSGDLGCKEPFC
jgi:hypothetical protein